MTVTQDTNLLVAPLPSSTAAALPPIATCDFETQGPVDPRNLTSGDTQLLQALALDLRQANGHLVIASLDASARESKATEAHQQLTLFLSMLAHELRNPLAPVVLSVDLLGKMPGISPAIQALQGILARQTAQLSRLVDDLMDATRINSGKIHIQKSPVLLSQLVAQAVETSQPRLDAHRQPIMLQMAQEPVWIDGDLVRLSQLLSNLILNASKFSADLQPILLCAYRQGAEVVLSVKDEGMGIEPDLQPHVFDLFTQGPPGLGAMASGLGIGLSLVRSIAELHGGSVALVSAGLGQGSEFIVTLPCMPKIPCLQEQAAAPDPRAEHLVLPALHVKRILLIDDNADINQSLNDLLAAFGHVVDCASDGQTGLRMASQQTYDVICCDIGMPGMDGYEVARHLRRRSSRARLIAISGYEQDEQRERALEAGFQHYLVKPVMFQGLLDLMDLDEAGPT